MSSLDEIRTREAESNLERGLSASGDRLAALRPLDESARQDVAAVIRERNSLLAELQAAEAEKQRIQRENFETEQVFRRTINKLDCQIKRSRSRNKCTQRAVEVAIVNTIEEDEAPHAAPPPPITFEEGIAMVIKNAV